MAGCAGADLPVVGVFDMAAGISGFDRAHAAQLLIDSLQTPEASATQGRKLGFAVREHGDVPYLSAPDRESLGKASDHDCTGNPVLLGRCAFGDRASPL